MTAALRALPCGALPMNGNARRRWRRRTKGFFRGFESPYLTDSLLSSTCGTAQERMAEREGFEPPDPVGSTHFECAPFGRSGTSPNHRS